MKIVTVGVYGYSESEFFGALLKAHVTVFYDIRSRRGMRGKQYAFVNATYLQKKLAELGIQYVHDKALAPNDAVREQQKRADKVAKVAKRERLVLSSEFVNAYTREIMLTFDSARFISQFVDNDVVCLFCVEHDALACHRSIIAERLIQDLKVEVEHIE
jgi:uncharacterized protein (DUF488 family)